MPDVLVIGAGHNGLVCACYLARAGHRVRMLERRAVVGGAAVTEEFHPGFRNSTASYTVSLLNPRVIADLRLREHGLRVVERPVQNFVPLEHGRGLAIGPTAEDTRRAVAEFSTRDAERLPAYWRMLDTVVAVLKDLLLRTPPNAGGGLAELPKLFAASRTWLKLDAESQRDVYELFTRSAGEILDAWLETDALKALYGFDAVVGNYASPYTPGSGYVLLHHAFGEVNGKPGLWGHAIGGMGAITQAMAREAVRLGVEIVREAEVARVLVENGRATGVALADGGVHAARAVVANVNPKLLYTRLVAAADLPPEFVARIRRWRMGSGSFRMNVALRELPRFACRPEPGPHLGAGIVIAPSPGYLDAAYLDARREGWSREPIVELLIPSLVDDTLAPPGHHVASLFCQQFAPELPGGRSWQDPAERERAAAAIVDTVTRWAPNFRDAVIAHSALSPWDLEERLGLTAGDIFHGALGLDQLWAARPMLGYADYRTPLRGLYLCGSGAHPGGGVTGVPGHNAAREILRDLKRSRGA
ncbi:MAG: NAD(P)/FAD-dependent oxidoreductase [Steroidobacteraceae bacterium]|jgi:phytoene dehydrogenase-like protein|nr:NAD(P)/FAD-dependent oxidoreductase [Steroidobacteraceae bacterium]